MNRKKLQIVVLISALIMIIFHLLNINYNELSNMVVNRSSYVGLLSMTLVALAMYLSIKEAKNK